MLDKLRYTALLKKYLEDTIDSREHDELFRMTAAENIEELLAELIDKDAKSNQLNEAELPADISEDIVLKILASEKNNSRLFIRSQRTRLFQGLSIAAVFLLVVFGTVFVYRNMLSDNARSAFEVSIPQNNIVKTNTTSLPLELVMEDGSTVKLTPRSSLSYPKQFANGKREVYLTGEAFFVVTKNPEKPFLVYYNNIVTRVLGTSFTIKTNNSTKNVEVSVRTGKVQVFENKYMSTGTASRDEAKSVILKPNQKAMYNPLHHDFQTTIADSIHPLVSFPDMDKNVIHSKLTGSFIFQKATSLKNIFSQLESVYGIEIVVDNDNIYNCVFTGDVSTQEMLEKLHIICLTIGAAYEVNGTKILVTGKGCNGAGINNIN